VAVQNLINTQGQYDLTSGMAWAATISSDTGQTRAYTTLITQAARQDPAAAQNAVDGAANLSDAQRAALTQIIQRTPQSTVNQNAPAGYHWEFDNNGNRHLAPD
jgi:cyanate lyase